MGWAGAGRASVPTPTPPYPTPPMRDPPRAAPPSRDPPCVPLLASMRGCWATCRCPLPQPSPTPTMHGPTPCAREQAVVGYERRGIRRLDGHTVALVLARPSGRADKVRAHLALILSNSEWVPSLVERWNLSSSRSACLARGAPRAPPSQADGAPCWVPPGRLLACCLPCLPWGPSRPSPSLPPRPPTHTPRPPCLCVPPCAAAPRASARGRLRRGEEAECAGGLSRSERAGDSLPGSITRWALATHRQQAGWAEL